MKRLVLILFCLLSEYFFATSLAFADDMSSTSFRLQFGTLNITSGTKTSASYNLTDTAGQTAAGQFGKTNHIVGSGFQYIYPLQTFSFKISSTSIPFGSLIIGTFATVTQSLQVTSIGAGGYKVTASEDHPMQLISNSSITIPNTSCDSGCTSTTAKPWTSASNTGLGYNMSGNDVPSSFIDSTYFKQFADLSSGGTAQVVMSSSHVGTNRRAVVTYQISIGASQAAGDYQTQVTYIATPGY